MYAAGSPKHKTKTLSDLINGWHTFFVFLQVALLDASLEQLLHAVRPYILHRAGLKLLEFLVRVHQVRHAALVVNSVCIADDLPIPCKKVHVRHPARLMATVLPYHTTPAFRNGDAASREPSNLLSGPPPGVTAALRPLCRAHSQPVHQSVSTSRACTTTIYEHALADIQVASEWPQQPQKY